MKKIISIFAIVLAITALMSVSVLAEETTPAKTFALADSYVESADVTVTPAADSIAVTLNTAVTGADYSILLVSGSDLPTSESTIAYINQDDAESASLAFSVLPKLDSCEETMTLYIGTNAGNGGLIATIPVTYKAVVVEPDPEDPENPDEPEAYPTGDVNNDGLWNSTDALTTLQIGANLYVATAVEEEAADVNNDNLWNSTDALMILQFGANIIDSWE